MATLISLPVVQKELRQNLRGQAALVVENLYLVAIAGAAAIAVLAFGASGQPGWSVGYGAFWWLVAIQAVVAIVLGATLAAPVMAVESEQKTADMLTTTPLTGRALVWSKLLSSFLVGTAMLSMSVPIAMGVFMLGGVSPEVALASFAVLYGALGLGVTCGLFYSTALNRTAAAVPVAVLGALGITFVFSGLAEASPALATFSPYASVSFVLSTRSVPLFMTSVPAWVVSGVLWLAAIVCLAEASAQRVALPRLRRLWGVRRRFAALVFVMSLAAVGSMGAIRPEGQWCVGST